MAWSASIPCEGDIQRIEIAGLELPADAFRQLRNSLAESAAYWVMLEDASLGVYRAALLKDGRLLAVIMLGRDEKLPPRDWLLGLMAVQQITLSERRALLAGHPADGPPPSPTLCVCHSVRASSISAAISAGCASLTEIGEATKAGTGCGSCRPEISLLLSRTLEHA
jgi:assimilatory nitrate reductase catalytic subunit